MKSMMTLLALGTIAVATPALAQVNARQANQAGRIDQGVANGSLTPREAAHLDRQQARIANSESRMRAYNGGRLTPYERARLNARQNRASAEIYDKKHNWRRD